MRTTLFLILFFMLTLQACAHKDLTSPDSTVASILPDHIKSGYQMVWNDEFDGTSVNMAKWNFRAEGTVRNYGTVSRQTISLDGSGHLAIKVTKDSNGKYYIGELGTAGIYEPTYGYFECRAKMNKQLGPHVAFWLQSSDMGKTLNPTVDGTEIDIFEYHMKTPAIVYHNLHWNGYGTNHQTIGKQVPYPDIPVSYTHLTLPTNREV